MLGAIVGWVRARFGPRQDAPNGLSGQRSILVLPVGAFEVTVCDLKPTPQTRTRRWNAATYLKAEPDVVAYLQAALEGGDAAVITAALGDIARAKGNTTIARKAGLARESLYKALSPSR